MQDDRTFGFVLLTGLLALGCASTKVSQHDAYAGGPLPKPAQIVVYDFAASPGDLPFWADDRGAWAAASGMDAEALEAGRKLGGEIAKRLVAKIDDMGMVAVRGSQQTALRNDDIAIFGYFTSVDEGSAAKRMVVGFGKGAAQVDTHAEGWRKTESGMVRLGGGDVASGGGSKGPGAAASVLVTVATANPIGLVVGTAVKAEGEMSGRTTAEGSAERIAGAIAERLEARFREQGWI